MHSLHQSDSHEELLLYKYRQVNIFGPTAARLTLQGSRLHCVSVGWPALLLLWERLDQVVDTEDGDSGLCGHLKALCFDHGGLIDTGLTVVSGLAVDQIQTNPRAQKKDSETVSITPGRWNKRKSYK